ncbi:hypothetical protein K504DRAFT_461312 [Pleomassaria siparia CBS 279.74]|uniref:Sas10 C-terminal domain-containing protein n=1 Tax=Pleomassaria siparia CBS 279.74 TaxID=1314801 RepID=A0A6G1JVM8_9PLEO|nr:hypothetical protein K504DRAFT_461312 [Pleomassaria siparia CBS 279.74]
MGKKRKASGRGEGEAKPRNTKDESKLIINTFEDVADEQDEFLSNRDKVLLDEGPAAKRLRKWNEQDEFLEASDEEVLGYSSGGDEDEEEDDIEAASDNDLELDDAVLGKRKQDTLDEDDDAGGWGPSKKDYYNADAIETEQDALDEEAEARRIQKKQLQAMTEADFGFDEDEWLGQDGGNGDESGNVVTEVLPQLQITDDMTEADKLKILKTRYPEFEFISKEYLRLQPLHDELAAAANAAERLVKARAAKSAKTTSAPPTPIAVTKYRACAAYLAAITMYFAILGSTAKEDGSPTLSMDPTELHEHAVMESLLKCQGLWARVESLPVADPMVEPHEDELSVIDEGSATEAQLDSSRRRKKKEKKEKKEKKSKAEVAAEAAQTDAKARRAEKLLKTEEELAALSSITDKAALRKAARKKKKEQPMLNLLNADDSDFGEETSFTAHELAEKAKKKKSLRFYTSQIVQKAIKRDAAGKDHGGDADIPHRERLRDRQARLQAEAEKRGQGQSKKPAPGVTLGEGGDSGDDADDAQPRGGASAPNDDDDYYDMVAARGTAKKAAKQELAAAYALAAREGGKVVPQEVIGADGKRKITYQIQKNKGLTPHRSKTVRNPRVKKKIKYEEKKKKLRSQKAVYSGGEARGGYAGELTGIKKGLVRSTKL